MKQKVTIKLTFFDHLLYLAKSDSFLSIFHFNLDYEALWRFVLYLCEQHGRFALFGCSNKIFRSFISAQVIQINLRLRKKPNCRELFDIACIVSIYLWTTRIPFWKLIKRQRFFILFPLFPESFEVGITEQSQEVIRKPIQKVDSKAVSTYL